ncbi:MAG: gliding motility-associated ABC transporter ATP-binding subunit GldA [Flavobacteriaceae bacterium]
MSIHAENITKSFGNQKALNNISFSIKKGEITGFLGPNGAGKTTMMRILTTYSNADSGLAKVNGYDVVTESKKARSSIGYLPEHNPLYLEMYVREYLSFHASLYQIPANRIDQVIDETGLAVEAHKKIGQLSKGYRQRIGLAAALLHDPEVLILDEPTTGLDPNQLIEIRKLIRTIGKEKTVLLSTHILKEVEAMCDRVLIINKGELVANSTLADLRANDDQIIEVEFDYRVEEVLLNRLPHVKTVRNIAGFVYEINFATGQDMRPVVFDFAHDNQLKTLQLSRKNKNLETLFLEVTS